MANGPIPAIKSATTVKRPKKLTRRWLKEQLDWDDWRKSEFKQLNKYEIKPRYLSMNNDIIETLYQGLKILNYKIADITLAQWGRKEITIAETKKLKSKD